jgi:hypothetical protein
LRISTNRLSRLGRLALSVSCLPLAGLGALCALSGIGWALGPAAWAQHSKLNASDPGYDDSFGRALAVSGDTLVATSRFDEHSGIGWAGSAYVLVRSGGIWTEQAKLTAGDAAFQDLFGHAVAIEGDTLVVGARDDDHSGVTDAGSAYVFVRTAGLWSEQAKLTASDAADLDRFGMSVAISGDTVIVGAVFDDNAGGTDSGAAYVFVRSGGAWIEQAKLVAEDGAAIDYFGARVHLSGDTAIVGAPLRDLPSGPDGGAAYVFVRSGSNWAQQARLSPADLAPDDQLGNAVFVGGDLAILGAPKADRPGAVDAGSVYAFVRSGGVWSQQAKLMPALAVPGARFGHAFALEDSRLLVGASLTNVGGQAFAGSGHVFTHASGVWTEQATLTAPDAANNDNFGTAVGLSGVTALIGSPHDDGGGVFHAGSVYVFDLEPDCDHDGLADAAELSQGLAADCNQNGVPDPCDIASGLALDLDGEGTPDVCQALSGSTGALSIASGGSVQFSLQAGPSQAGALHLLLGSLSGTVPGVPLDGLLLPLVPDAYLGLTLAGSGPLVGALGLLDASGKGSATLLLPAGAIAPSLAGLLVHHAFVLLDPSTLAVSLTSNPIPTTLTP